jgi:hypothetical protein
MRLGPSLLFASVRSNPGQYVNMYVSSCLACS